MHGCHELGYFITFHSMKSTLSTLWLFRLLFSENTFNGRLLIHIYVLPNKHFAFNVLVCFNPQLDDQLQYVLSLPFGNELQSTVTEFYHCLKFALQEHCLFLLKKLPSGFCVVCELNDPMQDEWFLNELCIEINVKCNYHNCLYV